MDERRKRKETGPVNTHESFDFLKKNAIRTAKDLFYGDKVIIELKAAKTVGEINRIMVTARKQM